MTIAILIYVANGQFINVNNNPMIENIPKIRKFAFSILERLWSVNPLIVIQIEARIKLIIPIEIKISEVNQVTKIEKHNKRETSFLKLVFKL